MFFSVKKQKESDITHSIQTFVIISFQNTRVGCSGLPFYVPLSSQWPVVLVYKHVILLITFYTRTPNFQHRDRPSLEAPDLFKDLFDVLFYFHQYYIYKARIKERFLKGFKKKRCYVYFYFVSVLLQCMHIIMKLEQK